MRKCLIQGPGYPLIKFFECISNIAQKIPRASSEFPPKNKIQHTRSLQKKTSSREGVDVSPYFPTSVTYFWTLFFFSRVFHPVLHGSSSESSEFVEILSVQSLLIRKKWTTKHSPNRPTCFCKTSRDHLVKLSGTDLKKGSRLHRWLGPGDTSYKSTSGTF